MFKSFTILLVSVFLLFSCTKKNNKEVLSNETEEEMAIAFYAEALEALKIGDAFFAAPPSFAQGASQSIEASKELYEEIVNKTNNYYKKRLTRLKSVGWRSKLNYFAFHLSNPIIIFVRNIILKVLVKNNKFLENYLGKIYKN